jgi:type IV pilus assembly protein PilV
MLSSILKKQNGFGLIEVLVAVVIVGIGMLAVVRMQVISMQANHEAFQRSLAVHLANDIIDKMRAVSPFNVAGYDNVELGGNSITNEPTPKCGDANGDGTLSSTENCATAEKILHDLWEWEQLLDGANELTGSTKSGGLMNANGCVSINNNHIEVIIAWDGFSNATKAIEPVAGNNCGSLDASDLERRRQIKVYTVI